MLPTGIKLSASPCFFDLTGLKQVTGTFNLFFCVRCAAVIHLSLTHGHRQQGLRGQWQCTAFVIRTPIGRVEPERLGPESVTPAGDGKCAKLNQSTAAVPRVNSDSGPNGRDTVENDGRPTVTPQLLDCPRVLGLKTGGC